MKKRAMFLLAAGLVFLIVIMTGCQNRQNGTGSSASERPKVKIGDINWQVEEGIIDGKRCVLLNITNQSGYTLSRFELLFAEKEGVTDEEKNSFQTAYAEKHYSFDEDDYNELREKSLALNAVCERLLAPGESDRSNPVRYYSSLYYVDNINHYALVEPDIAFFEYLKDDKLYAYYYDFKGKTYTLSGEPDVAYSWTDTALGTMIAKPDVQVVEKSSDSADYFSFTARSMNKDAFNAYVEDCKGRGFTVDSYSHDGYYSAENNEGYDITLDYYEYEAGMYVSISAPK